MVISISDRLPQVTALKLKLEAMAGRMRQRGYTCRLQEQIVGNRTFFRCQGEQASRDFTHELRQQVARSCVQYIRESVDPPLVHEIIQQKYKQSFPQEMLAMESFVLDYLYDQDLAPVVARKRVLQLEKNLQADLQDLEDLAIDGYIKFRLQNYRSMLQRTVQDLVDQYFLEKEYREFIKLLRYFVTTQPAKMTLVHVVHQQKSCFQLLRADGSLLPNNEIGDVFADIGEHALSGEDLVVSKLLSIVPERVVLHSRWPQENVINTLKQVFAGRIQLCDGCHLCE